MQPVPTYTQSDPISFHPLVVFAQHVFADIFSAGFLYFIYVVAAIILVALITLTIWLFIRMYEIREEDKKKKKPVVITATTTTHMQGDTIEIAGLPVEKDNPTWKHIRQELLSENPADWKLAIIEGDIYLDKVLDDKGFHGDTTSDKLKQVTPDKLPSIQLAREVHFIRNRIAHDGAAFVLTMPEARRLLSSYEIVFTDLGVI